MANRGIHKKTKKAIWKNKTKTNIRNTILIFSIGFIIVLNLFEMSDTITQCMRLLSFIGFISLAYFSIKENKWLCVIIYLTIGLLSQPFYGFIGGKVFWNIIDIILIIIIALATYKIICHRINFK